MKTHLAWHNLIHYRTRTTVAVAGVAFAVVLIFMQLGFLGAVESTATLLYDALDFDLLIRSRQYLHISDARSFPRDRLYQAASSPGVRQVVPFYVGMSRWQNPKTREKRGILVMGVKPGDQVYTVPELEAKLPSLNRPEFVLVDRKTRPEFGPRDHERFGEPDVGIETEVAGRSVRIVGHFELGTGLAANGAIVLNDEGFSRVAPRRTVDDVSLGLVKLAQTSAPAEVEECATAMRRRMTGGSEDVEILTRRQALRQERRYWLYEKSIGVIFLMGVAVAFVVGTAVVYQVLSADVANLRGEYATLKAMGYRDGYLCRTVLTQALVLALLGFVPGLILTEGLYAVTSGLARIPIQMQWRNFLLVLIAAVAMCALSGLGALRKVRMADPADLF